MQEARRNKGKQREGHRMKASGSEYVKERLAQLAALADPNVKKRSPAREQRAKQRKRKPTRGRRDLWWLDRMIEDCTGPDGEIYGHRD